MTTMADKMVMSLEDILKLNKMQQGRLDRPDSRVKRGTGPKRYRPAFTHDGRNRLAPYCRPKQLPDKWQHDRFVGCFRAGNHMDTSGKLLLSNLHYILPGQPDYVTETKSPTTLFSPKAYHSFLSKLLQPGYFFLFRNPFEMFF